MCTQKETVSNSAGSHEMEHSIAYFIRVCIAYLVFVWRMWWLITFAVNGLIFIFKFGFDSILYGELKCKYTM